GRELTPPASLALRGPGLGETLELGLELVHAPLDATPVHLELGLARAPGADAAGLLAQLDAAPPQPRQPVSQLRQLDLHHALLAVGVLGEDVEDQGDAVDDVAPELLLEVALLRRRQLVVEHDDVDVGRVGEGAQLVGLPGPDGRGGVGCGAPLQHGLHGIGAGGVGEPAELGQARLRLVQRPAAGAGAGADEEGALLGDTEVDLGSGQAATLAAFAVAHASVTPVSDTCVAGPRSRIVSPSSTSCVPPGTRTVTCSPTRRRRWATAADAHTPVPHDRVSPTPRSQTRIVSSSSPATATNS